MQILLAKFLRAAQYANRRAIWHLLLNPLSRFCKKEINVKTHYGFEIFACPGEFQSQIIFFERSLDIFTTYFMLTHLKPGESAWDIGAEKGWFSLVMAKAVGPAGRVYSFEPDPRNFKRLQRNIDHNQFTCATPSQIALAAKSEKRRLRPWNTVDTSGTHIRLDHTGLGHLVDESTPTHPGDIEVSTVSIDSFMRDNQCAPPKLMKLDVEGAELEVLRGGEQTLRTHRPILFIEYNEVTLSWLGSTVTELDAFVKSMGYERYVARNKLVRYEDYESPAGEPFLEDVVCLPA